jgi:hypothetical protein
MCVFKIIAIIVLEKPVSLIYLQGKNNNTTHHPTPLLKLPGSSKNAHLEAKSTPSGLTK